MQHRAVHDIISRTGLYVLMAALLVGTLWSGGYFPLPKLVLAVLLILAATWELAVTTVMLSESRPAVFAHSLAFWLFLAFAVFSVASVAWSETPNRSAGEAVLMLGYVAAFFTARNQVGQRLTGNSGVLLRWLVYAATFVAFWGIVTYLLRIYPYVTLVDLLLRAGSVFEYSNALGCFLLMALPVTLAMCLSGNSEERPLLASAASLQFAVTVLTFSRLGMVTLLAVSLYFLALAWRRGLLPEILLALLMGALTAIVALVLGEAEYGRIGVAAVALLIAGSYIFQLAAASTRGRRLVKAVFTALALLSPVAIAALFAVSARARLIFSSRFGEGFSAERLLPHRQLTWSSAYDAFLQRPVKGWGLGAFYEIYSRFQQAQFTKYAHNLLLQTAVDTGAAGAGLLGLFLIYVIWLAARQVWARHDPVSRALAIAALVFIVYNMFDWEWYVPALTVWFIVVVACLEERGVRGRRPAGQAPDSIAKAADPL